MKKQTKFGTEAANKIVVNLSVIAIILLMLKVLTDLKSMSREEDAPVAQVGIWGLQAALLVMLLLTLGFVIKHRRRGRSE